MPFLFMKPRLEEGSWFSAVASMVLSFSRILLRSSAENWVQNTRYSSPVKPLQAAGLALDGTDKWGSKGGGEEGTFLCLTHPHPQIPSKARAGGLTVGWRAEPLASASEFDEALTSQSLQELSLSPAFRAPGAGFRWRATVQTRGWGRLQIIQMRYRVLCFYYDTSGPPGSSGIR